MCANTNFLNQGYHWFLKQTLMVFCLGQSWPLGPKLPDLTVTLQKVYDSLIMVAVSILDYPGLTDYENSKWFWRYVIMQLGVFYPSNLKSWLNQPYYVHKRSKVFQMHLKPETCWKVSCKIILLTYNHMLQYGAKFLKK